MKVTAGKGRVSRVIKIDAKLLLRPSVTRKVACHTENRLHDAVSGTGHDSVLIPVCACDVEPRMIDLLP